MLPHKMSSLSRRVSLKESDATATVTPLSPKSASRTPSPRPTKPLKTYGRRSSIRPRLQEYQGSIFVAFDETAPEKDHDVKPPPPSDTKSTSMPTVEAKKANTEKKHQEKEKTKSEPELRINDLKLDSQVETAVDEKRAAMLAKHKAVDEAIAENDRAEKEYEQERLRLNEDLREAMEKGYVFRDVKKRNVSSAWMTEERGHGKFKGSKRTADDVKKDIRQLAIDRDRVWWAYFSSVEGLSDTLKRETRDIKWRQSRNPDYHDTTNKNTPPGFQDAPGCLYCDDDNCLGC